LPQAADTPIKWGLDAKSLSLAEVTAGMQVRFVRNLLSHNFAPSLFNCGFWVGPFRRNSNFVLN
jgi:hypothetical protein